MRLSPVFVVYGKSLRYDAQSREEEIYRKRLRSARECIEACSFLRNAAEY